MIQDINPSNYDKCTFNSNELIFINKINEIIDAVNKLEKPTQVTIRDEIYGPYAWAKSQCNCHLNVTAACPIHGVR